MAHCDWVGGLLFLPPKTAIYRRGHDFHSIVARARCLFSTGPQYLFPLLHNVIFPFCPTSHFSSPSFLHSSLPRPFAVIFFVCCRDKFLFFLLTQLVSDFSLFVYRIFLRSYQSIFAHLSVCLFVWLSICLYSCMHVCLSIV